MRRAAAAVAQRATARLSLPARSLARLRYCRRPEPPTAQKNAKGRLHPQARRRRCERHRLPQFRSTPDRRKRTAASPTPRVEADSRSSLRRAAGRPPDAAAASKLPVEAEPSECPRKTVSSARLERYRNLTSGGPDSRAQGI